MSWVFPPAGATHLFVSESSTQGQGHILVSTPTALGASPRVTAHVLTPGLTTSTIQLEPSAPGQFCGSFQEGAQGAYLVTVEAHGAGHGDAGQVGLDVPYSPEYHTTGVDTLFLRSLAMAGGGSVIASPRDAWRGNLQSVLANDDLSLWLLLLAVLRLPIDVGVRRLLVSRRELATIAAALPLLRRASSAREPAVPLVGALRVRRARRDTLTAPSTPSESPGMRLPRTIAPSSAPRPPARPPTSNPAEEPEEESVASRLLAARRRKA